MKAMSTKAGGADAWEPAQLLLLPDSFFAALAKMWAKVWATGTAPRRWCEVRVGLIEKRDGGWKPLSLLSAAWRAGARVAVQVLRRCSNS